MIWRQPGPDRQDRRARARRIGPAGAIAVEFALLAPVLLLVALGVYDFGSAYLESMRLENAARAGGQFALHDSTDTPGIRSAALNAAGLDPNKVTVAAIRFCNCVDGSAVACNAPCADGSRRRTFVTVTVGEDYHTLFDYPGVAKPLKLTGEATLRVQ